MAPTQGGSRKYEVGSIPIPDDENLQLHDRIRELEDGIRQHRDATEHYKQVLWDGEVDNVSSLPKDEALWSLLPDDDRYPTSDNLPQIGDF